MSEENVTTAVAVIDEREGGTSASNAEADSLCQGRHLAQKGKPEQSSDDAKFGQQIHEALRLGNPSGLDTQQHSIYDSMVEITEALMLKVFGTDIDNVKVFKERRFKCQISSQPNGQGERIKHSGKPDFVARLGFKGLIIEYKCLPGDVASSPTNMQLRDQAVLSAGELLLGEVYTAVNQPLVTHEPDLCLYNKEALKQAEQEMFLRVRNSNDAAAGRTAGEKQCQFCLARSDCPDYQTWAQSLIPAPATMMGVPVREWTEEQRTKFMEGKKTAQKWLDETYKELKALMKEYPGCVPGYVLGEGDKMTTITDPEQLLTRFIGVAKTNGFNASGDELLQLYMQCVKVQKGEFETLVRKVTGFKGKKLNATIEAMLDGIIEVSRKEGSIEKEKKA